MRALTGEGRRVIEFGWFGSGWACDLLVIYFGV